jgi:hypothetical protein
MRGLKALVAVMSLLIVAGLGLLAYGVSRQKGALVLTPPRSMAPLSLPKGSTVWQMTPYDGGLALYVTSREGEYIYFYDPHTGRPEGRAEVKKGP